MRNLPATVVAAALVLAGCGPGATAPTAPAATAAAVPADAAWTRLGPPLAGSWRSRFPDDGTDSFDDFVASEPVRADGRRSVLAFLPVGEFPAEERKVLDAAAEFAGVWFSLPVRVLDAIPVTTSDAWTRERRIGPGDGPVRQVHTRWFLDRVLPARVPDDAVVLLGVTMSDLYPDPSWNFVFGEASLTRRTGVYSLARYFPAWDGTPDTTESRRLALLRTLKVVTHETGHTFGLGHCTTWACNMNGSNSLEETDAQPLVLCPDCRRKLAWSRGLDVRAWHASVAALLARHGLADEAAWHAARASE